MSGPVLSAGRALCLPLGGALVLACTAPGSSSPAAGTTATGASVGLAAGSAPSAPAGAPGAQRLESCLSTLDDHPDELHFDETPSVHCLIDIGLPAMPPLLKLLDAPSAGTRLHAMRAIHGISRLSFGYDPRKGWNPDGEVAWREFWTKNDYDARDPPEQHRETISLIRVRFGGS